MPMDTSKQLPFHCTPSFFRGLAFGLLLLAAAPRGAGAQGAPQPAAAGGRMGVEEVQALLEGKKRPTPETSRQAVATLAALFDSLPPGDPVLARLETQIAARTESLNPSPRTPVSDPLEMALLRREANQLLATPVEKIKAHRTAETVYGAIPAGAPRVTRAVRIDTARTRWQSTGLYAVPGEVVTVTVPREAAGRGFRVRLGGHTDSIMSRPRWMRMPFGVSRAFDLTSTTTRAACAFGGAVYIDLGQRPGGVAPFTATLSGAIEAPTFILGQTTDEQWAATIRNNPAPYAELVGKRLIISIPSVIVRRVANLTDVMEYWDKVVALQDDLAGEPNPRRSPERIDLDVQISIGVLHSGYPIMGPVSSGSALVNKTILDKQGNWGYFHELGHNHQRMWWTFNGDMEVTENIFAKYCLEWMAGGARTAEGGWSLEPAAVALRAEESIDKGGSYTSKPERSALWFQLADEFGWAAYKKVFRDYLASAPGELPYSDQQKRDQWLIRFSKAAGCDLTPLLRDRWGLVFSPAAVATVKKLGLPQWEPFKYRARQVDGLM